jgi:hypothetical protein
MSAEHGSEGKAENVKKLREIERLLPNHGISVGAFELIYPGECYMLFLEQIR